MNPEELAGLGPLHEETGAVGAFNDDGTVNVAIIRPCTSRGRRLRGLPPIYTQEMLAEEAGAFAELAHVPGPPDAGDGQGHEQGGPLDRGSRRSRHRVLVGPGLRRRPRTTRTASSRARSVGKVIPYPAVKALLEADPQALSVSINAWPKGVHPGQGHKGEQGHGHRGLPA